MVSETTYTYEYALKDHLGSVRVMFDAGINDTANIIQETHYYPYGLTIDGLSYSSTDNNKLFSGKEYNSEINLNWYDFGARNYDAALGMWFNVDPMAEKYSALTPYNYCANNPVNFIDPTGMEIEYIAPVDNDSSPDDGGGGGSNGLELAMANASYALDWTPSVAQQEYQAEMDELYEASGLESLGVSQEEFENTLAEEAQSTDPTKTNFYSSNLEVLVSFPSDNNKAIVIPENRMENANNAIDKYKAGNMSSTKLFNNLSQHGQEYHLNVYDGGATIRKPKDLNYWYLNLVYMISQEVHGNVSPETYGLDEYIMHPIDW